LEFCLDCKLCSHHHIDYTSSQGLKMLGLIRYITSSSSAPHSLTVLCTTLCDPNWNMHPLPGTPLHRRIRPNSKELKKNSTLYHCRFFAGVCCSNYEGMLARLNISTPQSRRKHLDVLYLINVFQNVLPYLILLAYGYPLG
jgi:hypothetical protein